MLTCWRNQERETNLMSGRHSFSELTKDFTQERRRRIAEMKAEVLTETPRPGLQRKHFESHEVDAGISPRT